MKIPCTYITLTDIGSFESDAKLDTSTGRVINIKHNKDKNQENINTVYQEQVCVKYEGQEYTFLINYGKHDDYIVDGEEALQFFDIINLKEKIESNLKAKAKPVGRNKVKL